MAIIEQSIDVNVPAHAAYEQLMRFEQYPRFMEGVEEVHRVDGTHLRWHARMGGHDIEWDAEITEQVPDRCVAWRSLGGPRNEGRVQLQALEAELTRITLTLNSDLPPQPGEQPEADAAAMEDLVARRAQQDLARFKKFAEGMYGSGAWRGGAHGVHHGGEREPASAAGRGRRENAHAAHASDAWFEQRSGADRRRREPMRLPNLLQAWSDPVSAMRKMSDEVDQIAQKFIGRPAFGVRARTGGAAATGGVAAEWTPAVEVARRDNRFVVFAELPGVRREDVQIEIRSGKLTISGERRPRDAEPEAAPQPQRSERAYGHFHRVVALPEGADDDAASASMQDGVLEVTVPVEADMRPARRIEIRGA
jgi:HSP20 family molecular chaperone IbpA